MIKFILLVRLTLCWLPGKLIAQENHVSGWGALFHIQRFSEHWGASLDAQFRSADKYDYLRNDQYFTQRLPYFARAVIPFRHDMLFTQEPFISADWEGKDPDLHIVYQFMDVNEDFIDVFKLKLANGRSFSRSFPADSNNFMVNEKMLSIIGLNATTAVGKAFSFTGRKGMIVGVVKDFNFKPVQQAIEPLILHYNKDGGFVVVRTLPGKTDATIQALSKISQQLNPAYPFKFDFLDQDLANLYRGERQMGNIFNLFALLGIFISCLGLYGLSAFMSEQRTKEIGVRKVLGASVLNLVFLLSSGITRLILVAIVRFYAIQWK